MALAWSLLDSGGSTTATANDAQDEPGSDSHSDINEEGKIELVAVGNPHLSAVECGLLAQLCSESSATAVHPSVSMVCSSSDTYTVILRFDSVFFVSVGGCLCPIG